MKKPVIYAGIALLFVVIVAGAYLLLSGNGTGGGSPAVNTTADGAAMNTTAASSTVTTVTQSGTWEVSGPGPVWQLYTAPDGTIYSFQGPYGNTIKAIGPDGSVEWTYQVPDEWRVANVIDLPMNYLGSANVCIKVAYSVDDGTMFLYARETQKDRVMAIADGRLLWDAPVDNGSLSGGDASVQAQDGRVYVFSDYSVTAFGENGTRLFRIDNASAPPAVDDQGNVYVVPCISVVDKIPSSIVQAYDLDGTPLWQRDIHSNIVIPELTLDQSCSYDMLPLYRNQTLYLPTQTLWGYSVVALNAHGDILWQKYYDSRAYVLPDMPFDDQDRLYVGDLSGSNCVLHIIAANGSEITTTPEGYYGSSIAGDPTTGVLWGTQLYYDPADNASDARYPANNGINISDVMLVKLAAIDAADNSVLWRYDVNLSRNYAMVGPGLFDSDFDYVSWPSGPTVIPIWEGISAPGSDTEYLYWKSINYEWPVVANQTACAYVSQLYAIDKRSGQLLWQKPLDTLVTSMATANDTLYYGTQDGNIFGDFNRSQSEPARTIIVAMTGDDNNPGKVVGAVAGGATVAAAALLFLKFFGIGGLARARGQLAKNDNRNRTLAFIAGHPGSTLHEIAHGLGMNVGTVRYHLLILGVNHRIASFRSDGKYVRYFTNAGTYTKNEQFLLSLARRDQVRKILNLLVERPELSNLEISEALDMHDSATSRYLKELSARGVVAKREADGGRTSYSLRSEYREPVASALERLNGG